MNITDSETLDNTVQQSAPRTYRVTRSQMKEIWEVLNEREKGELSSYMLNSFPVFEDVKEVDEYWIVGLLKTYAAEIIEPIVKKNWPEYFYIPEGEPVLCRDDDRNEFVIRISAGNNNVYDEGYLSDQAGLTTYKQIIPFTKNPPK